MDPERTIVHVDMDAFFASVEQHDDPSLKGKPVLVGGASRRGVVAAASYEARPFGVGSAMPMAEALRRCPQAIVVSPRGGRYAEVSEQVFQVFHRYTPLVEGLSLDEAFLDVTGSRSLFGDGPSIARRIREEIQQAVGLTASAGVAPCKFAAKIASDLDKPDGLTLVGPDVKAFLAPLSIDRMWGVGKSAANQLRTAGIETIGDMADTPLERLTRMLGSWGESVHRLANGIDEREVVPHRAAKSIGAEQTYEQDLSRRPELERELLKHATRVARRLARAGLYGSVVRVKLKYADFQLRSRQRTLEQPVMDTDSIYEVACQLLGEFPRRGTGVRLVGLAVAELGTGPRQTSLFDEPDSDRRRTLEKVSLELSDRFGEAGVTRAALLPKGGRSER